MKRASIPDASCLFSAAGLLAVDELPASGARSLTRLQRVAIWAGHLASGEIDATTVHRDTITALARRELIEAFQGRDRRRRWRLTYKGRWYGRTIATENLIAASPPPAPESNHV